MKRSILISFLIALFLIQSPPVVQADQLKYPINVSIGDQFTFVVDELIVNNSLIPDGVNTPWVTGAWINNTDEGITADLTLIDMQGNLPSSNGPYDIVKMDTVNSNHDNIYVRDHNTSSYLVFLGFNSFTKPDLEIPNPYLIIYPRWDFYESNFQEILLNYTKARGGTDSFRNLTASFSSTPTTFSYDLEYWNPQNPVFRPIINQFAEYEKQTGLLNSVYINVTNLEGVPLYNGSNQGTPVLTYKYSRIIDSSTITDPNASQGSSSGMTTSSETTEDGIDTSSTTTSGQSETSTEDDGSLLVTPVVLLVLLLNHINRRKKSIDRSI
ncbi:MAG: hypothetical protein GPJ54_05625 [Candidatus Heimdallarchaeota archaeon]|nr:hypothetical protein [Candidatus Heimdallarchaeota archaeon]